MVPTAYLNKKFPGVDVDVVVVSPQHGVLGKIEAKEGEVEELVLSIP